jgi:hypothetical protein
MSMYIDTISEQATNNMRQTPICDEQESVPDTGARMKM